MLKITPKLKGFNSDELEKGNKALALLKTVLNSEEFKQEVLNFEYKGQKKFANNDGLTNPEIYKKIMEGVEEGSTEVDYEADLFLKLVNKPWWNRGDTIGYTKPGVNIIYTYRRWFKKKKTTAANYAGHVAHEWCHNLGFNHDRKKTINRSYSVPYGIGGIVDRLAKKVDH